jgi:hypothetical protein
MTLTNSRRLDSGRPVVIDSAESTLSELDNGSYGNVEYAIVASEGLVDGQFTFTEALETTVGIDVMDAFTFESLDEDGGTRHYRVKGEYTAIDAGIATPEEGVDNLYIQVVVNGDVVGSTDAIDVNEGAGAGSFDTVISVKDGDIVQFPAYLTSSQSTEVDIVFEVDEAAVVIS